MRPGIQDILLQACLSPEAAGTSRSGPSGGTAQQVSPAAFPDPALTSAGQERAALSGWDRKVSQPQGGEVLGVLRNPVPSPSFYTNVSSSHMQMPAS